jgi:DNA replication protein DnaC
MLTELIAPLKALHLHGMAQGLSELLAEQSHRPSLPEDWLKHLIQAEQTDRQIRALRYQLKAARFPVHRDLTSFDFVESPLSEPRIRQLATVSFTSTAHTLIFVGGTGTGKTHLAIALGVAAVHAGQRVRFYNVVDLVNQLEQEKQLGKAGALARRLTQVDAVILDELGYLPFSESGSALLFHLISKLYEKTALIVTTNLSFGEWVRVFGEPIVSYCLHFRALGASHAFDILLQRGDFHFR